MAAPRTLLNRLSSLLLWLCVASTATAQSPTAGVTLFGKIQDAQTRAALPYLPVQLQTERDSAVIGGALTNQSGEFTIAGLRKGVYVLVVRSLGYQPIRQRVLIGELSPFLDLGTLSMTRQVQTLTAVDSHRSRGGCLGGDGQEDLHGCREHQPGGRVGPAGDVHRSRCDRRAGWECRAARQRQGHGAHRWQADRADRIRLAERVGQPSRLRIGTHRGHHQSVREVRRERQRRHHQPGVQEAGAGGIQRQARHDGRRGSAVGQEGEPAHGSRGSISGPRSSIRHSRSTTAKARRTRSRSSTGSIRPR